MTLRPRTRGNTCVPLRKRTPVDGGRTALASSEERARRAPTLPCPLLRSLDCHTTPRARRAAKRAFARRKTRWPVRSIWPVRVAKTSGLPTTRSTRRRASQSRWPNGQTSTSTVRQTSARTPCSPLGFAPWSNSAGANIGARGRAPHRRAPLPTLRSGCDRAALDLSLIHISEPTRPY